ncbi:hypothetical protein [Marinobacterium weihaiense]|uniref:Flagellar protein FliS n=1 Tax=Marinobacterium weihaiense TaxID=2851016 RepID=A0ABS6M7V2_9GAMM|nr:hypothetical protein [Marinobacterium weihaiense]MBV0932371.1 hypothetical protein [Marinobacterium weihaiense]
MNAQATTQQQARLMIEAGEFILAIIAIHEQRRIADHDEQPSPFNDRTLAGLMSGLRMAGDLLWTEGSEIGEFMVTVSTLYQQRLQLGQSPDGVAAIDRTLSGLMPGLRAAGDLLLSSGVGSTAKVESPVLGA